MKNKILALACACAFILSSCGTTNSNSEDTSTSNTTEITSESTTNVESTTQSTSTTENSTESTTMFVDDTPPTSPTITAEEAQKIADEGMSYIQNKDARNIVLNTTYGDALRLSADGQIEDTSDDGLVKWLEQFWEKDKYYHDMRACYPFQLLVTHGKDDSDSNDDYFNFTCKNPKPMTTAEVEGHNNIISYMYEATKDENTTDIKIPKIVDGYSFDIVYNYNRESPVYKMYVIKTDISDEYKLDTFFTQYAYVAAGFMALSQMSKESEAK